MRTDLKLKYRPSTYEEVVGQDSAIQLLQGEPMNAYLLHGHTGSGKTTLARIFAKEHNAELIEIDSSSIGKTDILTIRETAKFIPLLNDYKVIVLDEVHALSNQAWQSLLKIIEESPKKTIWFLLTTEVHKVPDTIKNRARDVKIDRVPRDIIVGKLREISTKQGENIDDNELFRMAVASQGSVRQAIEYLQTYIETKVMPTIKDSSTYIDLLTNVYSLDTTKMAKVVDEVSNYTQDDINQLIATISDTMVFLAMTPSTPRDESHKMLMEYTNMYVDTLDPLRELVVKINTKLSEATLGNTIKELHNLLHEIVQVYNKANDNRYTLKAVLVNKFTQWSEL